MIKEKNQKLGGRKNGEGCSAVRGWGSPFPSPVKHLIYIDFCTKLPKALSGASLVVQLVKNPANAGDTRDAGSIPGSGRSPGGGNGNPLQDSCLENPMDRARWATVHRVVKSQTRLSGWHTQGPPWESLCESSLVMWGEEETSEHSSKKGKMNLVILN